MSITDAIMLARSPLAGLVIALIMIGGLMVALRAMWIRLKEKDEQIARLQETLSRLADRLLDAAARRGRE